MRRVLWTLALLAVVGAALVGAAGGRGGTPDAADRANRIATGLRCPVCQGLSVADSQSETARSIRADIRRRIRANEDDGEIRRAYVERYGEWILLQPQATGVSSLVWAVPVVGVLTAAGLLFLALRRASSRPNLPATSEDRALVAMLRSGRLGGHDA